MPAVAVFLLRLLDSSPPLDIERARTAQAIVILGGGTRHNAAEYGGDTLGRLTLERVRYGARVARMTELPVLVSGGAPSGGESEAKLMQDALQREFGVPVRWVERSSARTRTHPIGGNPSAALSRGARRTPSRPGGRGIREEGWKSSEPHGNPDPVSVKGSCPAPGSRAAITCCRFFARLLSGRPRGAVSEFRAAGLSRSGGHEGHSAGASHGQKEAAERCRRFTNLSFGRGDVTLNIHVYY
jgi:hypothetical protein